jgi:glutamine---fructose-6-phosphate transaminase (isomerizing)
MTRANHTFIEGPYLRDILDQPRAIRDTLTSLANSQTLNDFIKSLSPASYQRIVLTGMGGSFHILNPLYLKMVDLGYPVVMAEASELIYFMPHLLTTKRTLLIVVSQSGRSAEIIRLLDHYGERPTILAVTNDVSSPLAKRSDVVATIQAGSEASVSCKTTTASLAALAWIGSLIDGKDSRSTQRDLDLAVAAVEHYLMGWRTHAEFLTREFTGVRHLFVTGRGASLAATGLGGMIMKEAAHFHSEGLGSAAFRHGPFEMLSEDCFVMVFVGDPQVELLHKRLVEDVRQTGAKSALVGTDAELEAFRLPAVSKQIRPIVEMLPLHMASLALAAIAGREAGKFDRIDKVTASE